jgi:hypothetical protein
MTNSQTKSEAAGILKRCLSGVALLGLIFLPLVYAQTVTPTAQTLITKYLTRADEYSATFKNLTTEETKYIEDFDADGKLKKQRTIVSELLVYQPMRGDSIPAEYRSVRSVDGKPLPDPEKRALKMFDDIAKAGSVNDEWERVRKEWAKYDGEYTWWGFTINQAVALRGSRDYCVFALLGQEEIAGRKTHVVFYRQVAPSPSYTGPTYLVNSIRKFDRYRDYPALFVGKLWLDAETFQLHREERAMGIYAPNEKVNFVTYGQLRDLLSSPRASEFNNLVVARWRLAYQPSEFGIMTPKEIEISFYDQFRQEKTAAGSAAPELRLGHRTRYTYGSFKRFTVTGEETKKEIIKP